VSVRERRGGERSTVRSSHLASTQNILRRGKTCRSGGKTERKAIKEHEDQRGREEAGEPKRS